MATIENLPQELIDNSIAEEPSIFKNLDATDIINCSEALIGTRYEEYVTQKFLKPKLKTFASLPSLNESLKNEGWFQECQDTKLIVRLWKKYKSIFPGTITVKYFIFIDIRDAIIKYDCFIIQNLGL